MPSVAERPHSSQEALLRLEKGTASPTTQLNEAAQIIGLDLNLCASHPAINRTPHVQTHAAPKEEWVLRWLLKKLKAGKNYRVEPISFLLLRQLIDLIPPKTLATTLKDQKFLGIIDLAIADLEDDVSVGLENGLAEWSRSDSESSRTMSDSPHLNDKKGTKRKRAGENEQDAMDIDDQPQTPATCFLTFIRALDCLYSLVVLSSRTVSVDEVASTHLRFALKGACDSVAVTLGKSLNLAAVATIQFSRSRKTTDLQHLLYVFPAILDLWEMRSYQRDDSSNAKGNECFGKHCFERALRLQLCVRTLRLDTDERARVLHGLEHLIALHIVLPARAGFYDRGGSGIDYSADEPDWSAVQPVSDTFRPILCPSDPQNSMKGLKKDDALWDTAILLPEFFDIATRSVPKDTFRRQTHEAPWLETLFVAVAELAFSIVKTEKPSSFISEFVDILKSLFQVILAQDVRLSLHTLLTHASYTGLLKDELSQVDWGLTALFIELGADIFLPNSGLNDATKLLTALLDKIFIHWRSGASRTDGHYETIKNGIVIPLLRAFVSARDLPAFMQLWYEQLIAVETARSDNSSLDLFSVWEDDDVCDVYSQLMCSPLTHAHATAQMHAAAREVRAEDGKISNLPGAYAQFVILEAGLGFRAVNFADTQEILLSVIETVASTLSSKQALHWRWRLWRFVRNLLENNVHAIDDPVGVAALKLADIAGTTIRHHHKTSMQDPCAPLECFEAYRFALAAAEISASSDLAEMFNSLTGDVTDFIQSITEKDALESLQSPWDGRAETLDSSLSLTLAYFFTLVKTPDIWACIASETRRSLFGHILTLATSQYHSSSSALETVPPDARVLQAWACVVCHEYLLNSPVIAVDLVKVLSARVKGDTASRKLHMESLQRIPAPLITRRQRGVLLDQLQEVILQDDSTLDVTVGILSLMAKLSDMPKSAANLTNDWEPVYGVAKAVTLQRTDTDLQIMKAFRNLHRAVISKLLLLSEDDRRRMFKKMYKKVLKEASKLQSLDRDSMECFFLRISLTQLWIHREQLSSVIDETELASCRRKVFELVVLEVKSMKDQCKKQELQETITLIKILDALEDFEDLATGHSEVNKFLSKIESYVEKSVDSGSSLRRLIRRRVLTSRGSERSIALPVVQCAETLPLQQMHGEEQQLFIQSTSTKFRSMSVDELTRVIQEIRELGFLNDNAEYHLLVASLAVASLPQIDDKESDTAKALSSLCTAVTEFLSHSKTIEQFTLATECLDILLRHQTRSIGQWNIDSLLSAIAVTASKSGPRIDPEFSAPIYVRLCRLMGVLLGLHRQKLGGRFHVVLPAMKRLLDCLFARSRKRTRSMLTEKKQAQQPYWLAPLQAAHAVHFTRLLTSLCDPTVSAVSRPTQAGSGQDGLTDQTKKAKRIAGQYLQYLIMEYAHCSLRGSLVADVKATITTGVYSVFDVMSKDTMRALNAGLDVSGRAVFKGLYDDYMRFGKWNKG